MALYECERPGCEWKNPAWSYGFAEAGAEWASHRADHKSRFFTAPDGAGDDTIWLDREPNPLAILRECDLPASARTFWPTVVAAFLKEN